MEFVYNQFTFIVAFLILILFINMLFGGKIAQGFLALVLLSMIVFNSNKFLTIFDPLGGAS